MDTFNKIEIDNARERLILIKKHMERYYQFKYRTYLENGVKGNIQEAWDEKIDELETFFEFELECLKWIEEGVLK